VAQVAAIAVVVYAGLDEIEEVFLKEPCTRDVEAVAYRTLG